MERTHTSRHRSRAPLAASAIRRVLLASSLLAGSFAGAAHAGTLPVGGIVAQGTASITTNAAGTITTVAQTSARAVINWTSFSVSQGNSVVFTQPSAASATLNRVTGSTASSIAGQISSNGAVYLVNPNGIAITSTGTVNTAGGFVASTLAITDANFMAGTLNFTGNGSSATVSNAGSIIANSGAYVALLGGQVANTGTITVPLGQVGLGSGEQVALNLNGGNFLQLAVPTSALSGSNALVSNSGAISASGGTVTLSAATLASLVRNVVNMSGSINADSATGNGGTIMLTGGAGGTVTVSGSLSAQATGASGNGGLVETSGAHTKLAGIAVNTAAAHGAMGKWVIDPTDFTIAASGGDITGAALSANLANTNVSILSSGGSSGSNGDINVNDAVSWSSGGSLTLDAYHSVHFNAAVSVGGAGGVVIKTNDGGTGGGYDFGLGGSGFSGSLSYTGGTGSGASLMVNGTAYTLLWQASDMQAINASPASLGGNYALAGNIDASTVASFGPIGVNSAGTVLNGGKGFSGSFTGLGHTIGNLNLSGFSAQSNVGLFGYLNGTVRDIGVAGGQVAGSSNVGGLVGTMQSGVVADAWSSASVSSNAASGQSIGGLVGLQANGAISSAWASGSVSGLGADIGGLVGQQAWGSNTAVAASGAVSGFKNVGGAVGAGWGSLTNATASGSVTLAGAGANSAGGLVGYDSNMTITNSSASGAVIAMVLGATNVGGLVGDALGGALTKTFATGLVTTGNSNLYVGGLVGFGSNSTITSSYATGAVTTGASSAMVGGLVGVLTSGAITGSYASGNVVTGSGSARVGGLAGEISGGATSQDYAIGAVSAGSGSSDIGGLMGILSGGSISGTYASGAVSGGNSLGGLVGLVANGGTLGTSYWDVQTTGQSNATGSGAMAGAGATGLTTAQARNAASYAGWDFANTWYQAGDMRPMLRVEAAASVNGVITVTTLHQLVLAAAAPSATIVLGANINAAATNGANASDIWGAGGFVPMGTDGAGNVLNGGNGFTGSLNGQGHTISNLTISRAGVGDVGLIGYAGAGSSIGNVLLVNAAVSGGSATGALVGYDYGGTVSAASASGGVTAGAGAAGVGGLVGLLAGNGAITASYATDSIAAGASATGVGGLVGSITSGTVSVTYASGAVSGGAGSSGIGGLAGSASGDTIANSYSMGAVSGGSAVGGLVGTNAGSIGQSYAAGAVSGSSSLGGLVGNEAASGTITASVWNTQTTGRGAGTGVGSASGATGLTTAQMQDFTAYTTDYAGWDFTNVWAPPTQAGQAGQTAAYYPQLYALSAVVVANPGNVSRSYGAAVATPAGTVVAGGAGAYAFGPAGDSLSASSLVTSATPATANVGTYAILGAAGNVVTSAKGIIYREIVPQNGVLTITPASLTITYTASSASRLYGAANPALSGTVSASGLVGSDTLAGVVSGAASWSTSGSITSGVGTYAITGSGLSTTSANYTLNVVQAAGNASALSITPRPLTLTPNAVSAYYGAGAPATDTASASGLVNGDTVASIAVTSPATAASPVGTYSLSGSNAVFASGSAGNYAISYATNATGLTVNAAPVTVSYNATPVSQAYGSGTPWVTGTVSVSGLVNGDTLGKVATGSVSWTNSVTNLSNVGSYAITGSGLTAVANPNYAISIVQAAGNASAITVTPAPAVITYSAYGAERPYGVANGAYSGVISANGLVNGDTVAAVTTGTAIYTSAANTTTGVGKYAILGSGLVANDPNYAITFAQAPNNATDLTITPRLLTLTANALTRTYGAANPTTDTATAIAADATTGLVNGDTVASETVTSNATSGSAVGSYGLLGANAVFGSGSASNYAITYAPNQWGLTITPAPLTLTYTATATSRIYGATNPGFTGSVSASGLVNGDTVASATSGGISWTTTATSGSNVGSYGVSGSGLIAQFGNYTITTVQAASNATALTINPAALTITYTANPVSRIYGTANPAFTGTLSAIGLANGDSISGVTSGAAVFATTATAASGVGTYAINGTGLVGHSANYTFSFTQSPGNASALSITPRALYLTPNAISLAQGSAIPTSDGVSVVAADATTGLVNGDTVSSVALTSNATAASGVGSYALYGANAVFSAGSASNYTISYGVNQWGLTIY